MGYCSYCGGSGKVESSDRSYMTSCPKCGGRGYTDDPKPSSSSSSSDYSSSSSSSSSKPTVDWSTYHKQGVECHNRSDYENAVKNFNTALSRVLGEYNRANILTSRGISYNAMGDRDRAVIDWTGAADIYFSLFEDDIFGGPAVQKYGEIIEGYFKKIGYEHYTVNFPISQKELDSKFYKEKGFEYLGFLDEDMKDYEKAIEYCTQAINIFPGYNNYSARGFAYQYNKNFEAALSDFNKALSILGDTDPEETGRIYSNRASVYKKMGNIEAAIADYKKAADLKNEDDRFIDLKMLEELGVQYTPKPFDPSKKKPTALEVIMSKKSSSGGTASSNTASSSAGTSDGKPGMIMSLIFAFACGLFIAGMFSTTIVGIGGIVFAVAAVLGFIAWRGKKTGLKVILIGLIVLSLVLGRVMPSLLPRNWGGAATRAASSATAVTVTVTADALNLRAEASGTAEVLKTLPNGAVLTVTGDAQDGWLPVEYEGDRGWVWMELVE